MERVNNDASFRDRISAVNYQALGRQIVYILLWAGTVLLVYGALPLVFELRLFVVLGWVAVSGVGFHLLSRANQSEAQAIYDESLSQMRVAHTEIVMKMATYSKARDAFQEEHLQRVQKIAHLLAVGLGESEESAQAIGRAAIVHDLGNIGIPDAALGKPTELTHEEFNLIKTHTVIGEKLLGDSPLFELEREAMRRHHEWWNGEGYPDGIAGEEIPLVARITAVADVFGALITKRPHRAPWPLDRAIDYMRESNGTQFAPDVVEVFLELYLRGHIPLPPSMTAHDEQEDADAESGDIAPAFLRIQAPSDDEQDDSDSASDTEEAPQTEELPVVSTDDEALAVQQQSTEPIPIATEEPPQTEDELPVASPVDEALAVQQQSTEPIPIATQEPPQTEDEPVAPPADGALAVQQQSAEPIPIVTEEPPQTEDELPVASPVDEALAVQQQSTEPIPIATEEPPQTEELPAVSPVEAAFAVEQQSTETIPIATEEPPQTEDEPAAVKPKRRTGPRSDAIVSTGDDRLDQNLGGGVPAGSLMLIEGESGAGKSVLVQHFISSALTADRRVLLYSSENTQSSLLVQMDSLGMDVVKSNLKVRVLPASNKARKTPITLEALLKHMSQSQDWDLVVFDSLTGFLAGESDEDLLSFYTACKEYHAQRRTIITVVHSNVISDSNLTRIASLCDVYLRLRIDSTGDRLVKSMEVAKIRGATEAADGIFTFDVEAGHGIVPVMGMTKVGG